MQAITKLLINGDSHGTYSNNDIEKIHYAFRTILGELVKFLLLFIFTIVIADLYSFIYITTPLLFLRPFSGGLHFRTHLSCLLFSVFFYSCVIIASPELINPGLALLVFLLSITIIAVYSPATSTKRPSYSMAKQELFRSIAVLFVFICMILYFINPNKYMNLLLLTICFQSLQLVVAKEVNEYVKKIREKK